MAATLVGDRMRPALSVRRLALAGLVGPPLFVVVFLILGLIKPGYSPVDRAVSEGSIGKLGWIQIANFLVLGAALLLFGFGLLRRFGDRWSGRIGSALISLAGIGLLGAGVFVTDPGFQATTVHGNMHMLASLVVFLSLLIGSFLFARRFWPDWPFAIYSILSGLAIPAGFIAIGALGRWPGLVQRVMIVLVWTWLTVLALRLWRSTARA